MKSWAKPFPKLTLKTVRHLFTYNFRVFQILENFRRDFWVQPSYCFYFLFKILECKSIGWLVVEKGMVSLSWNHRDLGLNFTHMSILKDLARNMWKRSWNYHSYSVGQSSFMKNLEVESVDLLICYWTDRRFWVSVNNQPERSKVTKQYVVAKDFKKSFIF